MSSGIGAGYLYYCSFSVIGWHLQKCWDLRQLSQKFQEWQFSAYCEIFTGGNDLCQITVTVRVVKHWSKLLDVPSNPSFLVIFKNIFFILASKILTSMEIRNLSDQSNGSKTNWATQYSAAFLNFTGHAKIYWIRNCVVKSTNSAEGPGKAQKA